MLPQTLENFALFRVPLPSVFDGTPSKIQESPSSVICVRGRATNRDSKQKINTDDKRFGRLRKNSREDLYNV